MGDCVIISYHIGWGLWDWDGMGWDGMGSDRIGSMRWWWWFVDLVGWLVVDKTLDDKVIDKLVEEGKSQEVLDGALMSDDLRDCIGDIEQRHADVLRLERQVREVYELFKDLAVLVDVQQDSLDVIEKHIHAAKDYAEKGADHLKQAEDYQNSARKRQCCILVIIMVVLAVVIIPTVASLKSA